MSKEGIETQDMESTPVHIGMALQAAAARGDEAAVNELLTRYGDDPYYKRSALRLAAVNGHPNVVRILLTCCSHEIDEDSKGASLAYTIDNCYAETLLETMDALLSDPSVVAAATWGDNMALKVAQSKRDFSRLAQLCEVRLMQIPAVAYHLAKEQAAREADIYSQFPLLTSKDRPYSDRLKKLEEKMKSEEAKGCSSSINQANNDEKTPLFIAVLKGNIEIVKSLLAQEGVDINQADKRGETLLSIAVRHNYVEIAKLLLAQEGIDINQADNNGMTPLLFAVQQGNRIEITKLLLAQEGIDINQANNDGMTPLCFAAQQGRIEPIKLLLAQEGIDINQANNNGMTPLCFAAQQGRIEPIKLLLAQEGIDINQANNDGMTPLCFAAQQGRIEPIKLLLAQEGIDINQANNNGMTPLCIAEEESRVEPIKLLLAQEGIDIVCKVGNKRKMYLPQRAHEDEKLSASVQASNTQESSQYVPAKRSMFTFTSQ